MGVPASAQLEFARDPTSAGPGQALGLRLSACEVYRQGKRVLGPLDLELPIGPRIVVLGPNGAGKSTLLHVLQGLLPPTTGSIQQLGSWHSLSEQRFALVFQKPVMLRRSVFANVEHALAAVGLARADRHERAREALDRVGLLALESRMAPSLSGGEQQRLAIARAWAIRPATMLCDELTANLDPGASAEIERLLYDLSEQGQGLVMATHDLAQAKRLADIVVFVDSGRVHKVAAAAEFFADTQDAVIGSFLRGQWQSSV